MNVFIVERGYEYEGQGVIGVFASSDRAVMFALNQPIYESPFEKSKLLGEEWCSVRVDEPEILYLKWGHKFVTVTSHTLVEEVK